MSSVCEEEPELLNTPKSLNPGTSGPDMSTELHLSADDECDSGKGVSPRQLVFGEEETDTDVAVTGGGEDNLPTPPPTPPSLTTKPPLETDM